ncbi:hypothetical protein L1987_21463 [Smallanthus sonchifolius]|uniref:Uncharacterized protein n=1 Tax=Smallanthus sonchifolius TaxID=185202 RepID=A0ACB9ITY8_9ASTR|nr:hypothetical protein L1987_21463 [Smallanthus sonchifolius]
MIQRISGSRMVIESSLTSPESSLTQGDSDLDSTSVSSSMQGSISSATSSLDQYSSNVKEETLQKKPLKKSISKKVASFGSFMSSRRRAQSKLSQSSIKLSDDGSTTPQHPSFIEVSDESSNYVQKSMPKFTRTGSLRSVKIFRSNSKNRNKNKSTFKSKNSSPDDFSQIPEESHLERATFSSILKDSKFPEDLKHQSRPSEPEEILQVAKICPYQHCSLHGHHHHHHEPPTKRFAYLKRRTAKDPKIMNLDTQSTDKSSCKKRDTKVTKKVSDRKNEVDFSIEFYAKTRSEPLSSHDHDDAEFADILFGVNSLQEKKDEIPISNNRDFNDLNYLNNKNDENSNGSKSVLEKKQSLKKKNHMSMWGMIHQHMVSGLAAESGELNVQKVHEEQKSETKDFDAAASQETEIRKMFAIKLVRDAIEKILLPEVQDDQSVTSEVISEQDLSQKSEIQSDHKEESPAPVTEEKPAMKTEKITPNRWSYLKKVILLKRFVKELEKVKKFNPKKPRHIPLPPETEPETVSLRRQTAGSKKNSDEWMLDYALQKVVSELAPTQKRKVSLLVKAFETVAPAQDDPPESGCNDEVQRSGSEPKGEVQEIEDSKPDFEREKHIKMWHMIYQHVVTDIATKIGSDLLLNDEESTNPREVENQTERSYMLQFTQSDAVKLVRESVDEILLPDNSSHSQSVASDIASEQEVVLEKNDNGDEKDFIPDENKINRQTNIPNKNPTRTLGFLKGLQHKDFPGSHPVSTVTRLQHQKSKNCVKLKNLILLNRSIRALEGFRKLKSEAPQRETLTSDREEERVDLRRQMMDERKKAEQWMLDYAVQHIVTKLTPTRKKRVSMLVEAFEAVVPFPEV